VTALHVTPVFFIFWLRFVIITQLTTFFGQYE